jgi:hypothetical protein
MKLIHLELSNIYMQLFLKLLGRRYELQIYTYEHLFVK